jgi:hypothetical protein
MSELVVRDEAIAPATLFGTDDPSAILTRQTDLARTLAEVVRKQNLIVKIGQGEHVRVEGWTFLGSLLGVFPVVEWTREVVRDEQIVGWEARVEARTRSGEVVGAGEAECLRSENTWKNRDDYALRSMAQTRAVSKALRMPLGFVMQLAGFNPTPAEEMPHDPPAARSGQLQKDVDLWFPPEGEPVSGMGDPEPGIEFGADPSVPMHDDDAPKATPGRKKKLNVLVGTLRDAGHITTEDLWYAAGLSPEEGRDADGILHWSPLRDRMSDETAAKLIDWLVGVEATAKRQEEIDALTRTLEAIGDGHGNRAAVDKAIEKNRAAHADDPDAHAKWLKDQIEKAGA